MTHRKRTSILLVISFVLILVGSFFSNAINTDFGKIKTDRLYLMNDNGYTVSARIYIPKTATQEAPAPAMIICPGGDSPSDLLTPWASEIARRGFVVALVDYTGCGDTEVDNASHRRNPDWRGRTFHGFALQLLPVNQTSGFPGHF